MMEDLKIPDEIRDRLGDARRAMVFSGAGVSKESGLDTFRGAGGLWERMRPEELATPEAFDADPGKVWRWYAWRCAPPPAPSRTPRTGRWCSWRAVSVLPAGDPERRRAARARGQPELCSSCMAL